ncbi:hypothetical protein EI94DRAFT_1750681, partial [Lactarius quietus]
MQLTVLPSPNIQWEVRISCTVGANHDITAPQNYTVFQTPFLFDETYREEGIKCPPSAVVSAFPSIPLIPESYKVFSREVSYSIKVSTRPIPARADSSVSSRRRSGYTPTWNLGRGLRLPSAQDGRQRDIWLPSSPVRLGRELRRHSGRPHKIRILQIAVRTSPLPPIPKSIYDQSFHFHWHPNPIKFNVM